jgi:glycine/D-amino acid oxidase-like deaminating enzyme
VTGALLALALSERGIDTLVLERGRSAGGSTAASTALLLAETDAELAELACRWGLSRAVAIWRAGERAIDDIERLARSFEDVGFERQDALYLASDRTAWRRLALEAILRRASGFATSRMHADELLELGLEAPGALLGRGAVVDPVRLCRHALAAAVRHGAVVHERTRIIDIDDGPDDCRLTTARGTRIRARHVVVAAGYAAAELLGRHLGQLRTTYVLATGPIPAGTWPSRTLVWETARPYLYARPIDDDRLMIGGADSDSATDHRDPGRRRHFERIARRATRLAPRLRIDTAVTWAGTFGDSGDGLPYIGPVPGRPRLRAALGFGGNGITFAALAARLLAAGLCGERDDDLEHFALDR